MTGKLILHISAHWLVLNDFDWDWNEATFEKQHPTVRNTVSYHLLTIVVSSLLSCLERVGNERKNEKKNKTAKVSKFLWRPPSTFSPPKKWSTKARLLSHQGRVDCVEAPGTQKSKGRTFIHSATSSSVILARISCKAQPLGALVNTQKKTKNSCL